MKTTTDERIGLMLVILATVITGLATHNSAIAFAVFFALFGVMLAIKSWLEQIYQVLVRIEGRKL